MNVPRTSAFSAVVFAHALPCLLLASEARAAESIDVVSSPGQERVATRLVGELSAMSLEARLVAERTKGSEAVVRFVADDRVEILCCASAPGDQRTENVQSDDPAVLALRTAERLRVMGLGAAPPDDFAAVQPPAEIVPPPPPRTSSARIGVALLLPSPGLSGGASTTFAVTVPLYRALGVTAAASVPVLYPQGRAGDAWIEARPVLASLGPTWLLGRGRFGAGLTVGATYLRSRMGYEIDDRAPGSWIRWRLGPSVAVAAEARFVGPLSVVADLSAVYFTRQPAIVAYGVSRGEIGAPLVSLGLSLAYRFGDAS